MSNSLSLRVDKEFYDWLTQTTLKINSQLPEKKQLTKTEITRIFSEFGAGQVNIQVIFDANKRGRPKRLFKQRREPFTL